MNNALLLPGITKKAEHPLRAFRLSAFFLFYTGTTA
jgi:hypothetical protein